MGRTVIINLGTTMEGRELRDSRTVRLKVYGPPVMGLRWKMGAKTSG